MRQTVVGADKTRSGAEWVKAQVAAGKKRIALFGLRLGDDPRVMVTTTPRPTRLIKELVADPTVAISRGTTYANRANLAGAFLQQIIRKYEGTRLGRQELNAELLEDVPGALWNRALLEAARPPMGRAAISIRSARPPVITVIGTLPVGTRLKSHPSGFRPRDRRRQPEEGQPEGAGASAFGPYRGRDRRLVRLAAPAIGRRARSGIHVSPIFYRLARVRA